MPSMYSFPVYLKLREGPVPTSRPSPIPLPPDWALRDPNSSSSRMDVVSQCPCTNGFVFAKAASGLLPGRLRVLQLWETQDEAHYVLGGANGEHCRSVSDFLDGSRKPLKDRNYCPYFFNYLPIPSLPSPSLSASTVGPLEQCTQEYNCRKRWPVDWAF